MMEAVNTYSVLLVPGVFIVHLKLCLFQPLQAIGVSNWGALRILTVHDRLRLLEQRTHPQHRGPVHSVRQDLR